MRSRLMMRLEEDKIIKFRDRLYQKHVPGIMKSGTGDLKPVETCRKSENGNILIPVDDIIDFFFEAAADPKGSLDIDHLFSNLYLLFDGLTKETQGFSFWSDAWISEKEIEAADNKTTVDLLTKNLILSYFENVKTADDLLDENLETIIKLSREGKDYQILVAKTLGNLLATLKTEKTWREALLEIQKASIVCALIGVRLPQIDKEVLLKIVSQAREEIKEGTAYFKKILYLRDQLLQEEKNTKEYLKKMQKVDTALTAALSRIDECLAYAHRFMHITGSSSQGFMGGSDEKLKKNIAQFFFGYREEGSNPSSAVLPLNYSTIRYKIFLLLEYSNITQFACSLQVQEKYRDAFLSVLSLYFNELALQMERFPVAPEDKGLKKIENCLSETLQLIEKLGLEKTALTAEKKKIKKRYLYLLKELPPEIIAPVIDMKETFCRIIQDKTQAFFEDIRKVLIETCYTKLTALNYDPDAVASDELYQVSKKLIIGYALCYKPQRFFYQRFFEKYIGTADGSLSEYFQEISQRKKTLALAILKIFSDPNFVEDLLFKEQITCAEKLLETFSKK